MSEEEKYVKCQNCHQNIQESKMFLHEGFCLRNNKFCAECGKIFLVKEFEEHLKTHNAKNSKPPEQKRSPPPIPEKKVMKDQENQHPISEHRKNCEHKKKDLVPKQKPEIDRPKIKAVVIDDNLGLKQCEFCTNMFEDLSKHLKECKVKKMIEEENAKYYKDLEKRNREDDNLARKLAKEKIMDISKDEQMARNLQKELKPMIDTSKDEIMARNLQNQYKPVVDISNDEEMARKLQNQFGPMNDTSNDEEMARKLQNQFGNYNANYNKDEQMARMINQRERMRNNNQHQSQHQSQYQPQHQYQHQHQQRFNPPESDLNMDEDEDLKRAIEQSKKDFYH